MYRDPWINNELSLFRKYIRDVFVHRAVVETSGLLPADMVSLAGTIWESLTDIKSLNLEVPEGWPYYPARPHPSCSWDGGNFPYGRAHTREYCDFSFYWSLEGKTFLAAGDSLQTFIRLLFMRYSNFIETIFSRHWELSVSETSLTREVASTVASALGLSDVRDSFIGLFDGNGYSLYPGKAVHSPFSGALKDIRALRLSGQSVSPERYQVYAVLHTDSGAKQLALSTPLIRREISSVPKGLEAALLYKLGESRSPSQANTAIRSVAAGWNGGRAMSAPGTTAEESLMIPVDYKIPADLSLADDCFSAGDSEASASLLDPSDPVYPAVRSLSEDSDGLRAAAAALNWLKKEVFLYDDQYRTPSSGQAGILTDELPDETLALLIDRSLLAYRDLADTLENSLGKEVSLEISARILKRAGDLPPFRIVGVEDPLSGKTAGTGYAAGKSVTELLYEYRNKLEALRLIESKRLGDLSVFVEASVPNTELNTIESIYMALVGVENAPKGDSAYTDGRKPAARAALPVKPPYDRYPERKPVGWYVAPTENGAVMVCLSGDAVDTFRSMSPNETYSLAGPGTGVFTKLSFGSSDDSPLIGLDRSSRAAMEALKKALVRRGAYVDTDTVGGLVSQVSEPVLISPGEEGIPAGCDRAEIYRRLLYERDTTTGYNRLGVTLRREDREKALLGELPAGASGAFDVDADCRRLLIPNGGTVWPVSL